MHSASEHASEIAPVRAFAPWTPASDIAGISKSKLGTIASGFDTNDFGQVTRISHAITPTFLKQRPRET